MCTYRSGLWVAGFIFLVGYGSSAQASGLSISSATANPGGTAALGIALTVSGTSPAGLEWTMAYSAAQLSGISITVGPAATAAAKTLSCKTGSASTTCLLTGLNANAIVAGVVAYLNATIASGTSTSTVQISSPISVDARGDGMSVTSASGTITVPSLSIVTCLPTALSGGTTSTCTVTLSQAAPTGGSTVKLASNNTSLTVPASVTVAAGATTATFSAAAAASIASSQSATVTGTFGSSSQTAIINLVTAPVSPVLVSSLACGPTSLGKSAVSTCTVTLNAAAPTGGSSVTLGSNNTLLTVPASVTVGVGATTATFSATAAVSIPSNQSATVTATLGSSSKATTIGLVTPVLVTGLACSPARIGPGGVSTCTVTLNQTAPTGVSPVTLASNSAPPLTLVHVTSCGPQTFPGPACTIPSTGSGNLIVVGFQADSSNGSAVVLSTISDNARNTYAEAGAARAIDAAEGDMVDIWYARNSAAGATSITIAPSASVSGSAAVIWEFSGADLTSPLDQTAVLNSQPATSTPSGASVTTVSQNEAVISIADVAHTLTGIASGNAFTADSTLLGNGWARLVTSSPGTYSPQWTQNAAGTYASSTVSFKAASSGGNLSLPTSATVAAGASSTTFTAVAAATIATNQSVTVTATLGSSSQTATIILVTAPVSPVLVSGLACSPTSLGKSAVSTCTVTLNAAAPTGGSSVTLASNNTLLTVPASVAVGAGATTATFSATAAVSIPSNQSATVTATLGTSSQAATISLVAPGMVTTLACTPTSLAQSAASTCTVTISQAATTGGTSVTLVSNNTLLSVPASVTIASGSTTAAFSAKAAASITSNQSATVTATLGSSSQTATVSLLASGQISLSGVACSPSSLGKGAVSTCTVTLNAAAPTAGSSVALVSSNTSLTVPASVTIAAGSTTATFSAAAAASITSNQTATVTATFGQISQVEVVSGTLPNTSGGILQISLGTSTTPGELIVVEDAHSGYQCSLTAVTDSAGSTYTPIYSYSLPGNSHLSGTWYLANAPSGITYVEVTESCGQGAVFVGHYKGVAANSPLDQYTTSSSATASPWNSSAVTTTAGNELLIGSVVGMYNGANCNINASGLWTSDIALTSGGWDGTNGNGTMYSHQIVSTTQANIENTGTDSGTCNHYAGIATFKGATAVGVIQNSSQTTTINLVGSAPAPVLVSGLVCSPTSLKKGAASTCTMTLNAAAPTGGSSVTLASNNTLLTVPASVTAGAGATTATFSAVATATIATNQSATVTATLGGSSQTATIKLVARIPALESSTNQHADSSSSPGTIVSSLNCSPGVVNAGGAVTCELFVTASAQSEMVQLKSSDGQVLVPAVVTTRPNQSSLTFQAQSNPTSKQQRVTITATLGTTEVEDTIQLMGAPGPVVRVPTKLAARTGALLSFNVSAADASDLPVRLEAAAIPAGASFDSATGTFAWSPQATQTGTYKTTFTAINSARQSTTVHAEIEVGSGVPALNAVVSPCSPGAIGTLTGEWLAAPGSQLSDPTGASFDLGGTSVTVNGRAVPLLYSSAARVDFLCPAVAAGTQLSVAVASGNGASQPVTIGTVEAAPTILSLDDSKQNQGLIAFRGPEADAAGRRTSDLAMERNFKVSSHPAQPGDQIVIFATGLGAGAVSSTGGMLVRLSDVFAGVESVQAVSGYAGVYAIQVTVPAAMTFGTVPVALQMMIPEGHQLSSNSVTAVFEAVRQ